MPPYMIGKETCQNRDGISRARSDRTRASGRAMKIVGLVRRYRSSPARDLPLTGVNGSTTPYEVDDGLRLSRARRTLLSRRARLFPPSHDAVPQVRHGRPGGALCDR